jgi:hypothetical protein
MVYFFKGRIHGNLLLHGFDAPLDDRVYILSIRGSDSLCDERLEELIGLLFRFRIVRQKLEPYGKLMGMFTIKFGTLKGHKRWI